MPQRCDGNYFRSRKTWLLFLPVEDNKIGSHNRICPKCVQRTFHIGLPAGRQMGSSLKYDLTTGAHTLGSAQKNLEEKHLKGRNRSWRDGSMVKNSYCFCQKVQFSLTTSSGSLKLPVIPVPEESTLSGLYGTCVHMCTYVNKQIYVKKEDTGPKKLVKECHGKGVMVHTHIAGIRGTIEMYQGFFGNFRKYVSFPSYPSMLK